MAKTFIDCGGYDGCSVIKFLSERPDFSCITFEPNDDMYGYYGLLPTRLVRAAAWICDGTVSFRVDVVDGDGSTLIPEKRVDATQRLTNEQCPLRSVPSVDIDAFLRSHTAPGDCVVLKLDVEGAEYAILEKLMDTGSIRNVSELFVEFHWDRAGISEIRHRALIERLEQSFGLIPKEWDAVDFAIHGKVWQASFKRYVLLISLLLRRIVARLGFPAFSR